jgi:LPXTG-motif cell wall-anchored protein
VKIGVAKQQGEDTSAAEASLAAAKAAQQSGNQVDAALAAQKGVAQVDSQLGASSAKPTGTDYTPILMVAGAIVVLGGAYLLFTRKSAK